MHRGSHSDIFTSDIIEAEDGRKSGGRVIAINLGSDFCAEHEWGIGGIKGSFGISDKPERRDHGGDLVGADVCTVTKVPDELKFFKDLDGYAYLLFTDSFHYTEEEDLTAANFNDMLEVRGDEELSTAWSNGSFGIRMKNDALGIGTTVLGQIYDAFTRCDVMIFLGGGQGIGNSGLILAIRSRVPEDSLDKMREAHESHLNLIEAVEKTSVEEKLRAAGKEFYALSPRWVSGFQLDDGVTTEHPVLFWLNPMEQDQNNYGWYTIEQLLEWIEDEGPIPKNSSKA
jgi:hypothetical protein